MIRAMCLLILSLLSSQVFAQSSQNQMFIAPDSELERQVELFEFETPQRQKTAIELAKSLRCPQCQNQNLVESNSPLAKDLRLIVFQKINSGESEQQVIDFMTARYGEFVLYKPSFTWKNALLWGLPILLLATFLFASSKSVVKTGR
ncbi:cytochrome c-type biogenesis protein [Vibrio japonicus]|uniref:Cytochrome c-type biogenesis protein n=1 Tax=Vibrio japonicus TaxID=1824638 RepID=A0ABY5LGH7_9VIBR|nr:cytochrome c-type biogenesis protein [Vibrio japonicus]UUM29857.1 cytochrome c-type biogenesis protein CcmH [Vibrio japonicus]